MGTTQTHDPTHQVNRCGLRSGRIMVGAPLSLHVVKTISNLFDCKPIVRPYALPQGARVLGPAITVPRCSTIPTAVEDYIKGP